MLYQIQEILLYNYLKVVNIIFSVVIEVQKSKSTRRFFKKILIKKKLQFIIFDIQHIPIKNENIITKL